jgi:hypothetical protein
MLCTFDYFVLYKNILTIGKISGIYLAYELLYSSVKMRGERHV